MAVQLYLESLGASEPVISSVLGINGIGLFIGSGLWGVVSDHVKRRRLLALLAFGLAALIGTLALLPSTEVVLGTAFARFLFFSGFSTVSVAIISAASSIERRGKNLSYISSARAFGFAAGSIATGFVLEILDFSAAFALCAALPLVGLGILALLPSENPVRSRERRLPFREILSAGIVDLYIATALRQMAIFGTFSLLVVYMARLGIPPGVMGIVGATNTGTQVLALLLFGRLADRVGRRPIYMLGFALSAVTPCVFLFAQGVGGMVAGYVTLALSFSSMYVGAAAHIGDRVPHHRHGQMLGLYESSRGLGAVGPFIAGPLVAASGFQGMFLVMAGIAALGFLVMLVGGALHRRSLREATSH